ncbi:hypothetical protein F5890DRAFT_1640126 [Lentinula detonsa]|uniref:Major facilitator superfamily (MFS) profile domain-containing protein n=1 Tax=Lentinula detonsa TaxID=2804962 RepID=A0AA38PPD2_9AGAR|nr:hypothetical protein F5890DRAFT_1640126 [Lentinula detonsa]
MLQLNTAWAASFDSLTLLVLVLSFRSSHRWIWLSPIYYPSVLHILIHDYPVSKISLRKVRGALVSGCQFCITIGLLLTSCVDYATKNRNNTASYRIPICIQFAWGIILTTGLFLLPESPLYLVKKGHVDRVRHVLSRLRRQPANSKFSETEISELLTNHDHKKTLIPDTVYWGSWYQCFTGGLRTSNSTLRKTILGTSLLMQQWTGVNFIFYYLTPFLQSTGAISNSFLMSLIFTIINAVIVGAVSDSVGFNSRFYCHTYIFVFASTWGPVAWVCIGEIFPIQIRPRGVTLSTASNWPWNTIIAMITPYMVDSDEGNLQSNVFWVSLEQVDQMMAETTPRTSANWRPTKTFALEMGMTGDHKLVHDDERKELA